MRAYWTGLAEQFGVAGATGLQTGEEYVADLEAAFAATGFTLRGAVLDIGCGTGRLAKLVPPLMYRGVDITPAMVEYAVAHGRKATLIEGPESFDGWLDEQWDRIVMLSVFTHVSREVRKAYLAVIARLLAADGEALVDIFAGAEGGGFRFWSADPDDFRADAAPLVIASTFAQNYDGSGEHTYYRLVRKPCPS